MLKLSRSKGIVLSLLVAGTITILLVKTVNQIGGPRVQMVMMVNSVKAGMPVSDSDIRTETMPQKFAVNAITNTKDAIGKNAATDLTPGHPLLKADISDKPMKDGLYQGEVGVRVPVDAVSSGGAKPGDYVDVLVSAGRTANGQASPMSTLLKRKRIVALYNSAGQKIDGAPPTAQGGAMAMSPAGSFVPSVVEIAVNQNERDQLVSAGKIFLSINPWDSPSQQNMAVSNQTPGMQSTMNPNSQPNQQP